jgi:hypothetical protein
MWLEMSDKQKDAAQRHVRQVLAAFLMCGFSIRKAAIRIPVE